MRPCLSQPEAALQCVGACAYEHVPASPFTTTYHYVYHYIPQRTCLPVYHSRQHCRVCMLLCHDVCGYWCYAIIANPIPLMQIGALHVIWKTTLCNQACALLL
jgi:hypothetical protein